MAPLEAPEHSAPPSRLPRLGWLLGLAVVFGAVTFGLTRTALTLGLSPMTSAALGQLGILTVTLAFLLLDGDGTNGLGLSEEWERRDWAAVFGLVSAHLVLSLSLAALLLGPDAGNGESFPIQTLLATFTKFKPSTFMLVAAGLALLSGTAEELLFRGYLLTRLGRTGLPGWLCVSVSALVFGMVHLPGYGVVPALSKAISFGLPTAVYFWRRRRLAPLIAAHMITNFGGFMTAFIAATYF